jgi:hypothetical protein
MQQPLPDYVARVDGYYCCPAVSVAEEVMTALAARDGESVSCERG